jgi:hypothetical protein
MTLHISGLNVKALKSSYLYICSSLDTKIQEILIT